MQNYHKQNHKSPCTKIPILGPLTFEETERGYWRSQKTLWNHLSLGQYKVRLYGSRERRTSLELLVTPALAIPSPRRHQSAVVTEKRSHQQSTDHLTRAGGWVKSAKGSTREIQTVQGQQKMATCNISWKRFEHPELDWNGVLSHGQGRGRPRGGWVWAGIMVSSESIHHQQLWMSWTC